MDGCGESVNPYLACSDKLQQFRNFHIEEYRAEVRQLQTATSQWYLSILNDQDCLDDLAEDCALPTRDADDETTVRAQGLLLGRQESLHLHGRNSRESSGRGFSLRSGHASLLAEPVSSLHPGAVSSIKGQTVAPMSPERQAVQRSQQPSLLDLCPTIFGAIPPDGHDHSEGAITPDPMPGNTVHPQQSSAPKQLRLQTSQAVSLTSMCPSIEYLLDGAEDAPIEAVHSLSSRSSSPYSAAMPHPKGIINAPQSMLDLQPSVIGCFSSSSSDKSATAVGPSTADAPDTASGVSTCLRSTIPAFHQGSEPDATSERSLTTASDSGPGAVPVFCHGVAATLAHNTDMLDSMRTETECTDDLSRVAEFGIQSWSSGQTSYQGLGSWLGRCPSLQDLPTIRRSLPAQSTGDGVEAPSEHDLRRSKSLAPARRSMLTPAAACNGGQLLPEVPLLQTYKNGRPPRSRRTHFKSSVVILDTPTVNMYEANADTVSMTVSAISQPLSDSSQHRRRKRNRRRGSYMNMRSALDFAELGRQAEPQLEPLRESGDGADATQASDADPIFPCCTASHVSHAEGWRCDLGANNLSCSPSKIMDTQTLPATQVSCERHGGLRASLEVLCQALIDSRHLSVCLELGLKISNPPTWIEMLSLLLRSLEAPARGGSAHHLSSTEVSEICHQIALVFFPIGSAMAAMQRNLMLYIESAGCHAPRRSQPNQHVPACPPLSSPIGSAYTSERLADAWNRSGQALVTTEFEGRPGEYLTQLLPRVMFDYIASLISVGMRIDGVARSHGVSCTKALDIIKSQVGMTLEGLSMLTSTLVHTVMAVCQGSIATADIGGLLSSLSPFLCVSLEHMAASVSLINGRMPLNTTDEALQELARAERTWYQQCTASTAFFHCLSVCGHMLTILEGLEGDLAIWQRSEQDSPATDLLPGAVPQTPAVSLCGDGTTCSEGECSSQSPVREPPSQLGYQWQILFDVIPKVQATSSRLVMLVGSLIKSASDLGDNAQRSPSARAASSSILGRAPSSPHKCGNSGPVLAGGLSPASLQPPVSAPPSASTPAPGPTASSVSPLRLTRSGRTSTRTPQQSLRLSIPSAADEPAAGSSFRLTGMCSAAAAQSPAGTPKLSASMSASACRTARRLFSPRSCWPCISHSCSADADDSDGGPAAALLPRQAYVAGSSPPNILQVPQNLSHTDSCHHSLHRPPGLSWLQVGDGAGSQGEAVLASPQASAFTTGTHPASPGPSRTPRHTIAHLHGHSSTSRSLRDLRSPSLAIEEPRRAWGVLSSEEHPMSPVAQMLQRRIHSESWLSMNSAPPFTADALAPLSRGSCGASVGAFETPPPSLQPRDVSSHSASALLQPHSNRDLSKSMVFTSLTRALGTDSAASSPFQRLPGAPSGMGSWDGAAYPTCLTVREVARVQEALAQGVVSLGMRLMQLLTQRCNAVLAVVPAEAGVDAETTRQPQAVEVLSRCQGAVQAQLSMGHNMQRWTNVLPGSMEISEGVCFDHDGGGRVTVGPYGALKGAVERLRELTGQGLRRLGAAAGESRLGQGRLVELLLGSAIKPLGKKSLGSVWMHHLGRELVAVKWITIEDDVPGRGYTSAQKQGMLIREVEAMMRLQHPNIVRLLGVTTMVTPLALAAVGTSGSRQPPEVAAPPQLVTADSRSSSSGPGLAMAPPLEQATVGIVLELCMYGTLQDFLNQTRALFNNSSRIRAAPEGGLVLRQGACMSPLEAMCLCFINSWSQRLRLCREIAAALAACHTAGVLHRDLTSFNVMLSDMHEVQPGAKDWALRWRETNEDGDTEDVWSLPWATRLIDFGLSKHSMDQSLDAHASIDVHSIPWMAPEMFISTQHLKASDVYGLGMVIWEVLSTHKPPTSNMQTFIATGLAFSGATSDSPGPCEEELAQLLSMHDRGDTAVLMRKLHGVPCPVLPEVVSLIRDTQKYRPQDRITAAEAARRLAKLETQCANVPPGPVPQEDQELARYWRDTADAVEEVDGDLAPFSSTSSLAEGEDVIAPWVHHIVD